MNKKKATALWGINIVLYIAILILVCVKGETFITCMLGWAVALMTTGLLIYLQCRLIDKEKTIDEINEEWLKAIHDWKAIIKDKDKTIEELTAEKEALNQATDSRKNKNKQSIKAKGKQTTGQR